MKTILEAEPGIGTKRKHITAELSSELDDFLGAQSARVVLSMPGCHEVFGNMAHQQFFKYQIPIATSKSDALYRLRSQKPSPESPDIDSTLHCYCYAVESIISLIARHCIFEESFSALEAKREKRHETIGAFKLLQREERVYQLFAVDSFLLKERRTNYLGAVFSRLRGLLVTVRTKKSTTSGMPKVLEAETTLDGREFISPVQKNTSKDRGYNFVYNTLSETIAALQKDPTNPIKHKVELLKKIAAKRSIVDYDAVHGFINGIFNFTPGSSRGIKEVEDIIAELRQIQARLHDANIVVDVVIRQVLKKISQWTTIQTL